MVPVSQRRVRLGCLHRKKSSLGNVSLRLHINFFALCNNYAGILLHHAAGMGGASGRVK